MTKSDCIGDRDKTGKYSKFFEELKEFKKEQEKQKQRGLNDFNLLTIVRKYHDERYLHSAMIGALIDKDGKHYQGTLFLDIFLDTLGILDYDTQSSKVYTEQDYIDIYLTDGTKHIVIENKIWAGDQYEQINRYIDTIKKDNKNLSPDDLYVVYLSTNRERPSKYSLGDLTIDNSNIIIRDGIKIAQYKAMHYKKHILEWLKECQKEVGNITNLNEVLRQYIEVVQMVNGNYEGKVKNMKEVLLKDDNLRLAIKIPIEIRNIKIETQRKFWELLKENLENYFKEKNINYELSFVDDSFKTINIINKCKDYYRKNDKRNILYGIKFDLNDIDDKYKLCFYIEVNKNIYFGFTAVEKGKERKPVDKNKETRDNKNNKLSNFYNDGKWSKKETNFWVCKKNPKVAIDFRAFRSDIIFELVDDIFNYGNNNIIENLAEEIVEVIEKYRVSK